jgi:hypothetical protein
MLVSIASSSNTLWSLMTTVNKNNVGSSLPAAAWRQSGKMKVRITNTSAQILYVEFGTIAAVAGECIAVPATTGVFEFEISDLSKVQVKSASGSINVIVSVWPA